MNRPKPEVPRRAAPPPWLGYAWALVLVGLASGAALVIDAAFAPPDVALLFLVPIMISAAWHGRGPSVFAAAVSVAAFNFFLVPPRFTFEVAEPRYLLTFVMMLGVGLVISGLASRLRAQQLARLHAAAEAADADRRARTEEVRSTLLSAVSHDLRTPLAVITGTASALRNHRLAEGEREELLTALCDEAERLERLVGNLLDMTRLQAGAVVPRAQWLPLEEVIGSALARLERRLGDRPVQVTLEPELPLLWIDPVLIEQVLVNFVDNAIKYSPADHPIELRSCVRDGEVVVQVLDRGPGLPGALDGRAFDRFVRGDAHGRDGFGLGLAICREIVELHGGSVATRPRAGGGACFEFALPRRFDVPSAVTDEPVARESA